MEATVSPGKTKSIAIVDDHPLVRRGLAALIDSHAQFAVHGEADSRHSALKLIREHTPDLVIVDLALGQDDGLELIRQIHSEFRTLPVLVLSMYEEALFAERAFKAGAKGYISKRQLDEALLDAVGRLLDGGTYISTALQQHLAEKYLHGHAGDTSSGSDACRLSDRELQVFRLIGEGNTTREIAAALHLSIKTIESHREHIKKKLALRTSAELAHRSARWVAEASRGN